MVLKYPFLIYRVIKQHFLWICQAFSCLGKKSGVQPLPVLTCSKNILIVVPHADDEWVGCSQVIQTENNVHVLYLNFPQKSGDYNADERLKELKACCEKNNVQLHECDDIGSTAFVIRILIKQFFIQQIFVPSFCDWHPDHMSAVRWVTQALRFEKNQVEQYCYQVSCPILSSSNVYYIPIKNKWREFRRYYKTQKNLPVLRFKLHEILNGLYYGVGIVPIEVYIKVDFLKLEDKYLSASPLFKEEINNIIRIREDVELYFNEYVRNENIF